MPDRNQTILPKATWMRIGFVSHHPTSILADAETRHKVLRVRHCAQSLVRQGVQVQWIASTDTAAVLAHEAHLVAAGDEALPATCRHVLSCQAYDLEGVQLLCLTPSLWQNPALHTRLFTFLCLFQQAQPCRIWHAWGTLAAAYATVYTARFLGIPTVVSDIVPALDAEPQLAFAWQWVAQHASRAVVDSPTEQQLWQSTGALSAAHIEVIDPASPEYVATLLNVYQQLHAEAVLQASLRAYCAPSD
jgi:hypothetical protein